MLVIIKPFSIDLGKSTIKPIEKKFVEKTVERCMNMRNTTVWETEDYYRITGKQDVLYQVLYELSKDIDIELI